MWSITSYIPALCALIAAASAAAPSVTIDAGVVIGTTTTLPTATASVNKFLGIPFAQSPPQRFSPPVSPKNFSRPINATAWRDACVQQFMYPAATQAYIKLVFNDPGGPAPTESEDCLYINVYAPSTPSAGKGRAVMFWLYGGALQFGSAGQYGYDGSSFAAYQDVIVVAPNYRTNVFGFPSSPELNATGHNLGFLDQRLALDWVQRNIHAFGGDPKKVTIFGESAGAFSVDTLITSYPNGTKPPFRAAIAESGQYSYRNSFIESNLPSWYNLTATLGCPGNYGSNLTCVRAANASLIKTIIEDNILIFNPIPDNVTLVSDPAKRRVAGNIARVPVLGGTNAQEGRAFTVGTGNFTTYLQGYFQTNLPGFANTSAMISTIEALYPLNVSGVMNAYDQSAMFFTDIEFQCAQALWANATAAIGVPAWRYFFNGTFANTQPFPNLGTYHSSEISLVFGTYPLASATTQENALSISMQSAWARFAKNPAGGPGWNAVGTGAPGMVLQTADEGAPLYVTGGAYISANSTLFKGDYDLGVFGTVGNVQGGGVTVIRQSEVDSKCAALMPIYQAVLNQVSPSYT